MEAGRAPPRQAEEKPMSEDRTPEGMHAGVNGQSQFVGNLAMGLLILAVLFALFVLFAAMTHGGA
jgi:hypothetical protein